MNRRDHEDRREHGNRRDHGGGLAAAAAIYGGQPQEWLDLSTGINPVPYPVPEMPTRIWSRLPDSDAFAALERAARAAYDVPEGLEIVAAPGAQALIQLMPRLQRFGFGLKDQIGFSGRAIIVSPTYNEHAAAFRADGWQVSEAPEPAAADALVVVSPNNPDGRVWTRDTLSGKSDLTIIDESFGDVMPEASLVGAGLAGAIILRSFGKFFGLAGVRLGFAIAPPKRAADLREMLGPWAVSGPALEVGTRALSDRVWIEATRERLLRDCARLKAFLRTRGMQEVGGTPLFQTVRANNAQDIADRLARAHILVRQFPYAPDWLRFGLPGTDEDWARLEAAL